MTTIREATAADLPALHAMALEFLATSRYGALLTAERPQIDALVTLLQTSGAGVVLVACDGEILIGMLALIVGPHPLSGELMADELAWWVAPLAREGRVGLRLLRAAEGWAVAHGVVWLTLVEPLALEAVGRYARLGYTAIETRSVKRLTPIKAMG